MGSCASQTEAVESAEQLLKDKLYEQALEALMKICETGGAEKVEQFWKLVEECCKGLAFNEEQLIAKL
jgi:hypothetical protein